MKSRSHVKLNSIIAATNFNTIFRRIYREFETDIFLKIKNKEPAPTTLEELIASGCMPKHSNFFSATCYMRIELTINHVKDLSDTIFSQLYPVIRNLSPDNIEIMIRSILEALSKKILQMDLLTFQEMTDIDFRQILLASPPFMKAAKNELANIKSILMTLPESRDKYMHEYESYMTDLINSKSSLWHLKNFKKEAYEKEIESEFVLSTIKLA